MGVYHQVVVEVTADARGDKEVYEHLKRENDDKVNTRMFTDIIEHTILISDRTTGIEDNTQKYIDLCRTLHTLGAYGVCITVITENIARLLIEMDNAGKITVRRYDTPAHTDEIKDVTDEYIEEEEG